MKRERVKELLPIMQAYAEGKTIQCKDVEGDDDWKDIKSPTFNDAYVIYRIKPTEEYIVYSECYNANKCYLLSSKDPINTSYRERFRGTKEECQKWIDEHTPKYRPYKDTEEMIADFKQKMNFEGWSFYVPMIWVRTKDTGTQNLITAFDNTVGGSCVFVQDTWKSLADLFEDYEYLDGSPIGVKE